MTAKKNKDYEHSEVLDLYEQMISRFPDIARKGKTMPYTSVNGNMFSFLDKEGRLSIRLPEIDRTRFLEKYKSQMSEQHGRIMKEYVLVPHALLQNLDELLPHFSSGYEYTKLLKPK